MLFCLPAALLGGDGRGDDKSQTVEAQGPRCVLLVWDWLPCVWPLVLLLCLLVLLFFLWGPLLGLSSSHHPFLVPSASCTSSTPAPQLHAYTAYTLIPTLQCDVVLAVIDSLIPIPCPRHTIPSPPPSRRTPPQDCHPLQPPCSSHREGHHSTN